MNWSESRWSCRETAIFQMSRILGRGAPRMRYSVHAETFIFRVADNLRIWGRAPVPQCPRGAFWVFSSETEKCRPIDSRISEMTRSGVATMQERKTNGHVVFARCVVADLCRVRRSIWLKAQHADRQS